MTDTEVAIPEAPDDERLVFERPYSTPRGLVSRVYLRSLGDEGEWSDAPLGEVLLMSLQERYALARAVASMLMSVHGDERSPTADDLMWPIGHAVTKVLEMEHRLHTPILLPKHPLPTKPLMATVDGMRLLLQHPTVIFGDGETAKSLVSVYLAGRLAYEDHRVLYLDWELSADEHRQRLQQLFGEDMPPLHYLRCEQPLVDLVRPLRAYIAKRRISYVVLDSLAFACGLPAERQEAAMQVFRAIKDLGPVGSLCIAHNTKHMELDGNEKPFGSVFWHNGARATYFVERLSRHENVLKTRLSPRKTNLTGRGPTVLMTAVFPKEDSGEVIIDLEARS